VEGHGPHPVEWLNKHWTERHAWYLMVVWVVCNVSAFTMDAYIVFVLDEKSISEHLWEAQIGHPEITALGSLATCGVGWLVRFYRAAIFFTGLVGGHLFLHM